MTESRIAVRCLMPALLLLVLAGCGSSTPTDTGDSSADIQATAGLQFLPPVKTVTAGSSVTWAFGVVAHTVVFDGVAGHPADIASPTANQSVARTFAAVGTYPYHCTIHAGMSGSVQVVATAATAPPPPPPTTGYP